MTPKSKLFLRVNEAAEQLRLRPVQVRDLIEEGKLHAIDVGTGGRKSWRIPATAVQRCLANPKLRSGFEAERPASSIGR